MIISTNYTSFFKVLLSKINDLRILSEISTAPMSPLGVKDCNGEGRILLRITNYHKICKLALIETI